MYREAAMAEARSHRAPKRRPARRRIPVALAVVGAALVLTSGATLALGKQPDPARSAPVDLSAPLGLSWDDLHQWCVDRQHAGTDGLSNAGKLWLKGCADAT